MPTKSANSSSDFLDQKDKFLKSLGVLFALARKVLPGFIYPDEISATIAKTMGGFGRRLEE